MRRPHNQQPPTVAAFDPFEGAPTIHSARRVGIRPGTELIHPIAATGLRPLRFDAVGLPDSLHVDNEGILRGTAPDTPGTYRIDVTVTNAAGSATDVIDLVVGSALALTPPMGWNSWNVFGEEVSAEVIIRTAEKIVASGMRDLGYQYVNIDDFWHADRRADDGTPLPNPVTFPDGIGPVADALHAMGLKLGIYSDAAHLTCGNCFGGYGYEAIDAQAYAAWGVDLLKYDYCHAPRQRTEAEKRYAAMARALEGSGRSIMLSVCEWGLRRPWRWARSAGGAYWRTTPDIFDTFSWSFLGVRGIAWWNMRLADHAGPGGWNDPDMLLVGNRGAGRSTGVLLKPGFGPGRRVLHRFSGLSDTEAHSHMTLWAMMAAPLLASHDLASANPFDMALLTNPAVLAVNQDIRGEQARRVRGATAGVWMLRKPLSDGGLAVSVTNVGPTTRAFTVDWDDLGAAPDLQITDAWSLEPLGDERRTSVSLPPHGSAMFVARPSNPSSQGTDQ